MGDLGATLVPLNVNKLMFFWVFVESNTFVEDMGKRGSKRKAATASGEGPCRKKMKSMETLEETKEDLSIEARTGK